MKLKFSGLLITGAVALAVSAFVVDGPKPVKPRKFIDPANMDLSVKPGDDFLNMPTETG